MKYNTLKLKTSKKICKFALYALFMTGSGQYAMAMKGESTTEKSAQKSPAQIHAEDLNAKIQATHQHITQADIQAIDRLVAAHKEQSAKVPSFDEWHRLMTSIPDDSSKPNGTIRAFIGKFEIQAIRDFKGKVFQITKSTRINPNYLLYQLVDELGGKTITTIDNNKNKVDETFDKRYQANNIRIENIEDRSKPIAYYYDNGDKLFINGVKDDRQFTSIKANGDMIIGNKDGSISTETNENVTVTKTSDSNNKLVSIHTKTSEWFSPIQ